MPDWVNDKKNMPIIAALLAAVVIAAIVFVLFQTGVLGGTPAATDASASAPAAPVTASAAPVAPVAAPAVPAVAAMPAAAPTKVAVVPVAGAPGARPDPFEPYVDFNTYLRNLIKHLPPPPRVDSYVPFVRVTNYVPPSAPIPVTRPPGVPAFAPGAGTQTASIGRVSGVMLTNGAFAIVDSNGQSSILQPGDQLPNGGGRVISIQSDGITVRTSGDQMVKVPISAGDTTNPAGGPGGPYGPNGPQGPPNIPGNQDQPGDAVNGG